MALNKLNLVSLNDFNTKLKVLGQGAFGTVYLIEDKFTKIKYALKKVEKNQSLTNLETLAAELDILTTCRYPTIIKLYGAANADLLSFITEYLPNGSLNDYISDNSTNKLDTDSENESDDDLEIESDNESAIDSDRETLNKADHKTSKQPKRRKLDTTDKFIITYGIALGMNYLIQKGVLHRDLKPDNVLLDDHFYPRICDFGLSTMIVTKDLFDKSIYGTPAYCAPEIFELLTQSKKEISKGTSIKDILAKYPHDGEKADVYSFGITIWCLFMERKPEIDIDPETQTFIRKDLVFSRGFPRPLQTLIENCCQVRPEKRPRFKDIVEDITNIMKGIKKKNEELIDEDKIRQFENFLREEENKIRLESKTNRNNSDINNSLWNNIWEILGNESYENKSYGKAIQYFERAANDGSEAALFRLGMIYGKGLGVPIDHVKALHYYEGAAEKGSEYAMTELGIMYSYGLGTQANLFKAKEYFERAGALGDKNAYHNLGYMYDINHEYEKARYYYEKSLGGPEDALSLHDLGTLYLSGQGVPVDLEKAKDYFQRAANKGSGESWAMLGQMYERGVPRDYDKARHCYEQGVKKDDPSSLFCLGLMYEKGQGVVTNYEKAQKYIKRAEEKANSLQLYSYGLFYFEGRAGKKSVDYEKARYYFEKAGELGEPQALRELGKMYLTALGVPLNYQKARNYFEKAIEKGDTQSYGYLGEMYRSGLSVPRNEEKALYYFQKGVEYDDFHSLFNLGQCYQYGINVPINYSYARGYYERAIEKGYPPAAYQLGRIYYFGGDGVEQDYEKARYYLEISAPNVPQAYFCLGVIYFYGRGVEIDYQKSRHYYEEGFKNGETSCASNLGYLYKNGIGVERDYEKALFYYKKGSERGEELSYNNIGTIYRKGQGVPINFAYAKQCYQIAAQGGESSGLNNLGELYEKGLGVPIDYNAARQYYEAAVAAQNSSAYYNLARLYEQGKGVAIDVRRAQELYRQAEKLGYIRICKPKGDAYYYGIGVEVNYDKAREYYEKSKKQTPNILIKLGIIYLDMFKKTNEKKYYEKSQRRFNDALPQVIKERKGRTVNNPNDNIYNNNGNNLEYWDDIIRMAGDLYYLRGYIEEKGKGIIKNIQQANLLYRNAIEVNHDISRRFKNTITNH